MPSPGNYPTHAIVTVDLGVAHADALLTYIDPAGATQNLCGRNLTVMALTGAASIRFDRTTNPLHALAPADRYEGEDFMAVLVTNIVQAGKTLVLRASWEPRS